MYLRGRRGMLLGVVMMVLRHRGRIGILTGPWGLLGYILGGVVHGRVGHIRGKPVLRRG